MGTQKLSDFKALLFDVDRTLTDSKREISPETIDALKILDAKGYQIGVCSGRGVATLKSKVLPLFPKNSIHIAGGGSQLVDNTGKALWERNIDEETIKNLKEFLKENNLKSVFMKTDAQYTEGEIFENLSNDSWNFSVKKTSEMTNDGVGSIYIPFPNNKIIEYIEKNDKLSFKSMLNNDGKPYIDVTAKNVSKATALKKWSEISKIELKNVIGFGDSFNDLEFLESCGFSVAMGNSVDELKNIADRIIGDTNENSLSKYLLKIISGENL